MREPESYITSPQVYAEHNFLPITVQEDDDISINQFVAVNPQYEEEKAMIQCKYESEYKYGTNKVDNDPQTRVDHPLVQNSQNNQSVIGQNLYEPSNQSFQFGPGQMYQSNQDIFLKS